MQCLKVDGLKGSLLSSMMNLNFCINIITSLLLAGTDQKGGGEEVPRVKFV